MPDFTTPKIVSGYDLKSLFAEAHSAGFWPCRMAVVRNGIYEVKFQRHSEIQKQ